MQTQTQMSDIRAMVYTSRKTKCTSYHQLTSPFEYLMKGNP